MIVEGGMLNRTFFSFSSRDAFVPRLLSRLRAQALNVWVYADEGEEIPGGERIESYLRDRVRASTLFIPVVSLNSLQSAYARAEVACALACQPETGLRIIPLVETTAAGMEEWPFPYAELRGFRYHEFDGALGVSSRMEDAVARVCQDVGVPYVGLVADTPRLPLMQRVEQELACRVPSEKERANTLYFRLQNAVRRCKVSLAEADYVHAAQAIEYFLAMAENEYEGTPFYYPYVVRAVCLVALGRLPESAEQLSALRIHPECEETVFGTLGYIRQAQGLFAEAAALYREALRRDPSDPAAAAGVVVNETLAGEKLFDLPKACRVIETGRYLSDNEQEQAQEALALGLARMGQGKRAAAILFDRIQKQQGSPATYINLANVLVDLGQYADAHGVLHQAWRNHAEDAQIARCLVRFLLDTGRNHEAVAIARQATELIPDHLDLWFERLLIERRAGCKDATQTAERLACMLPIAKDDFYYTGYANWVLGRGERATYDLERSGESGHYEAIDRPAP